MGGRGGSSHRATGGGGRLGTQGKPLTAQEALPLVNPKYLDALEYQINCQRCVWAFEMLRRGYSVEAARSDSSAYEGSLSDIWRFYFSANNAKATDYHRLDHLSRTVDGQFAIVEEEMKKWGEGSRAILANSWASGGGHIWNVEYINGAIHYYDGQIGREVDVMERNRKSAVLDIFARVDNLDIPSRIMEAVIPKKRRR